MIELIVVIVILAILVGVTIGGISGYVRKARINTDIHNAKAIEDALQVLGSDEDLLAYAEHYNLIINVVWDNTHPRLYWKGITYNIVDKEVFKSLVENKIYTIVSKDELPKSQVDGHFHIKINADKGKPLKIRCNIYKEQGHIDGGGCTKLEPIE